MPSEIDNLIDTVVLKGLEHFNRYYGTYRGIVVSNTDPEKRGRVLVFMPDFGQSATSYLETWIDPVFDYAGKDGTHGSFWAPEEGDLVRVFFWNGVTKAPVAYLPGWYPDGKTPKKLGHDEGGTSKEGTPPIKRGWVTTAGHALVFNDKKDAESIELSWKNDGAALTIDKSGTVSITTGNSKLVIDQSGKKVTVQDENENTVVMENGGITVKSKSKITVEGTQGVTVKGASIDLASSTVRLTDSATEPAVKGQSLMTWLSTHTHGTGVGPSSPPLAPPPQSMLSVKAKVG